MSTSEMLKRLATATQQLQVKLSASRERAIGLEATLAKTKIDLEEVKERNAVDGRRLAAALSENEALKKDKEEQIAALTQKLTASLSESEVLKRNKIGHEEQIAALTEKLTASLSESEALKSIKDSLEEQIDALSQKLNTAVSENERLATENTEKEASLAALEERSRLLSASFEEEKLTWKAKLDKAYEETMGKEDDWLAAMGENQQLTKKKSELEATIDALNSKIVSLSETFNDEIRLLREALENAKEFVERTDAELVASRSENEHLAKEKSEMEATIADLNAKNQSVSKSFNEEIRMLREALENAKEFVERTDAELMAARSENEQFTKDKSEMEATIAYLHAKNQSMSESFDEERRQLREDAEKAMHFVKRKDAELMAARSENERLAKEKAEMEATIADLNSKNQSLSDSIDEERRLSKAAMEKAEEYVKGKDAEIAELKMKKAKRMVTMERRVQCVDEVSSATPSAHSSSPSAFVDSSQNQATTVPLAAMVAPAAVPPVALNDEPVDQKPVKADLDKAIDEGAARVRRHAVDGCADEAHTKAKSDSAARLIKEAWGDCKFREQLRKGQAGELTRCTRCETGLLDLDGLVAHLQTKQHSSRVSICQDSVREWWTLFGYRP